MKLDDALAISRVLLELDGETRHEPQAEINFGGIQLTCWKCLSVYQITCGIHPINESYREIIMRSNNWEPKIKGA